MARSDFPVPGLIWLGLGAVAFACATAEGEESASNAGATGGASSTDGDVNANPDGASESDALETQGDQTSPDAEPCTAELKINELQTAGPNGERDEFVELFNDGTCTLLLDAHTLSYRSREGEELLVWSAATGQTMQPGQFFV
ncbi:MAG: hypothetical protein U1E22_06285, partial [Coriobacteriia bacterium]|nr:hypothetical protein [Coriobacteriia bacterium]